MFSLDQRVSVQSSLQGSTTQPNTPSEAPRRSFSKAMIVFLVFLALASGGVIGYLSLQKPERLTVPFTQRPQTTPHPLPTTAQPGGELGPQYIGYQTMILHDTRGGSLSGSATRSIVPSQIFRSVYATLPEPSEGEFYQAWVVRSEGDFFLLGRLQKDPQGTFYVVFGSRFDSSSLPESLSSLEIFYNTTLVTLERVDDHVMETKILEGTFTQ